MAGQRATTGTISPALDYEAVQDRTDRNAWRVEAIDYANDGNVYVALFMGPNAQERAMEYAAFKNLQH